MGIFANALFEALKAAQYAQQTFAPSMYAFRLRFCGFCFWCCRCSSSLSPSFASPVSAAAHHPLNDLTLARGVFLDATALLLFVVVFSSAFFEVFPTRHPTRPPPFLAVDVAAATEKLLIFLKSFFSKLLMLLYYYLLLLLRYCFCNPENSAAAAATTTTTGALATTAVRAVPFWRLLFFVR
jgi:hypothetical protein